MFALTGAPPIRHWCVRVINSMVATFTFAGVYLRFAKARKSTFAK